MKLSIIIPAYNCEKTIKNCISSILNREIHGIEVECIVVDDGSLDATRTIIQAINKKDDRIKYLYQENRGAGAARNLGLKHISGDYVWFIDGDDEVCPNAVNIIKYELNKHSPEVLLFAYKLYDEAKNSFAPISKRDSSIFDSIENEKEFSVKDYPELLEAISYPWNKVYSTNFIQKLDLSFSETIVNNDIYFNICALSLSKRIIKIADALYTHAINKIDGQLTQIFDERRLNLISVLTETEEKLRASNLSDECIFRFLSFKFNVLDWAIIRTSGEIKERFIQFLNEELSKLNAYEYLKVSASNLFTKSLKNQAQKIGIPKAGREIFGNNLMLSVVVPIYNVEPYLAQCLQSIANQTLNSNSFEVIMVDDKSTDSSATIAEEFTKKYSNFKLIKLDENTPGGAGIPSNIGINASRGRYIGFVDSDDYIEPTMFEDMLMSALMEDSDICICDFKIHYEKEKKIVESNDQKVWKKFIKTVVDNQSISNIKSQMLSLSPVPWRKIYKKSFLDQNNIRYPECEFFFEDNPLHWFVTAQLNKFSVVNKALITHRIGRVGQTMEGKPEKLIGFATHAKTIKEFLDTSGKFNEFKLDFLQWYLSQTSWVYPKLGGLRSKYLKTLKELCKEYTFKDIKAARKIKTYKFARIFYNQCLIKGYPRLGKLVMNIIDVFVQFAIKVRIIK